MRNLTIMIKPASSLCNLRCKYCFYANLSSLRKVKSFGIMSNTTMENMIHNIFQNIDSGDKVSFVFQGGEPTLAGLSWFQSFVDLVNSWKGIHISYALQTNAVLLDEQWCRFLKKYNFLVGVSWDILPECQNEVRVDTSGKGTQKKVLESIALLNAWKIKYNVLCTLTNFVARYPNQVWKQLVKYDIRYIQFTPCLDDLDRPNEGDYALCPKRFASFYDQIFHLWEADVKKGKGRSVKLFDDIMNLMVYGVPSACGMDGKCNPQIVVEADGSVYPCDFFCVDEYKLGNLAQTGIRQIYESEAMRAFLTRPHQMPALCKNCRFARFCGGNCKRMQRQICCTEQDFFCGYQDFLNRNITSLQSIARMLL